MPRIQRRDSYLAAMSALAPSEAGPYVYEFDRRDPASCLSSLEDYRSAFPGERLAILSVNGATGQQLLMTMKSLNLQPGRDLGLCTFDDWAVFSLADVTTIRLHGTPNGADRPFFCGSRGSAGMSGSAEPFCLPVSETGKRSNVPNLGRMRGALTGHFGAFCSFCIAGSKANISLLQYHRERSVRY